jgi:hypothetical protein
LLEHNCVIINMDRKTTIKIVCTISFFVVIYSTPGRPLKLSGYSQSEQKKFQVVHCNMLATLLSEENRTQVVHCNFLAVRCQNKTDFKWPTASCCLHVVRGGRWGRISYGPSKLAGYQLLHQTEFKWTSSGSTLQYTEDIYTRKIVGYIVS